MDELSTGDKSGRLDTSGVDSEIAQNYARRMFDAVLFVRCDECKKLHDELNQDWPLYQLSLDLFKSMCKQRGFSRINKWSEYIT